MNPRESNRTKRLHFPVLSFMAAVNISDCNLIRKALIKATSQSEEKASQSMSKLWNVFPPKRFNDVCSLSIFACQTCPSPIKTADFHHVDCSVVKHFFHRGIAEV